MRVREDYRTLTGAEKSAILLLSLGEDHTAKIFEQLDEDEIMQISQTMSTLGKVSANVTDGLAIERSSYSIFGATAAGRTGDLIAGSNIVNNLSAYAQPAAIDLRNYQGMVPVELLGNHDFPPIGEQPYFLSLSPYSFFWFRLERKADVPRIQ